MNQPPQATNTVPIPTHPKGAKNMRYRKLNEHLLIAKLPTETIKIPEFISKYACFFIAEHTEDPELIRKHAVNLFSEDCFDFAFFGTKREIWKGVFDQVQDEMYPDLDTDVYAATTWSDADLFCRYLDSVLTSYESWFQDCFLFYDDEKLMRKVVERLKGMGPYVWE